MTTPNIVRVAAINGNTVAANVITYSANVVVNPTGSNQLYKIYSLHLCNYTGAAVTANVTIGIGTVANNYLVGNRYSSCILNIYSYHKRQWSICE